MPVAAALRVAGGPHTDRDTAVVLLDVALEDVGARAEDAPNPRGRSSLTHFSWAGPTRWLHGPVHQQSDLAWRGEGAESGAHSRNASREAP